MTVLQAMLLGLVQGVTEFLPVSSSGHLAVLQSFFGMNTAEDNMLFDVLLHLGTLCSICFAYRKDLARVVNDCAAFVHATRHPAPGAEQRRYPGARLLMMMAFATLPLVLVLPVHGLVERLYYSTVFIGIALILTGSMLWVADRMPRGRKRLGSMGVMDALTIGLCQAVATIPGLSRSGTTITAGLSVGLERRFAVKFSFLISIPAVLGANLITLIQALGDGVEWSEVPAYLVGMVVAAGVGYLAIGLMQTVSRKGKFGWFAYYCFAAGALTLILNFVLV